MYLFEPNYVLLSLSAWTANKTHIHDTSIQKSKMDT